MQNQAIARCQFYHEQMRKELDSEWRELEPLIWVSQLAVGNWERYVSVK